MYVKKPHNRGLSNAWYKIPMTITYEAHGARWETSFEFTYDQSEEAYFTKLSGKRL